MGDGRGRLILREGELYARMRSPRRFSPHRNYSTRLREISQEDFTQAVPELYKSEVVLGTPKLSPGGRLAGTYAALAILLF